MGGRTQDARKRAAVAAGGQEDSKEHARLQLVTEKCVDEIHVDPLQDETQSHKLPSIGTGTLHKCRLH